MKRILLVFIVLALTAGIASADHRHHGGRWNWNHHGGWSRPAVVVSSPRVVVAPPRVYAMRRPIYVQRPAIRYRYFNYYQRPAVMVENYPARDGYYWVAGQWQWSGYEWTWQPGHYEPDPNYQYNNNYDYNYQGGASVDVNYQSPGYSPDYSYEHDCN